MDVEIVTSPEGLSVLEEDWRRLEQGDGFEAFFCGFEGVSDWWAGFSADEAFELRILVARHNGRVLGILPLALHHQVIHREHYAVLRFASHGDVMSALVDPEGPEETICRSLVNAAMGLPEWDQLILNWVPFSCSLARYLRRSELKPQFRHVNEDPFIDLPRATDGLRRVPGKARNRRNRLYRDHDVVFRVYYGNDGRIFERLGALHQQEKLHLRAKGRDERHSWFDDALRVEHYRRLYSRPNTTVTFAYETRDGLLIAARSAFRRGASLLSWTSAYHPDYEDYRLGTTLMLDVLEHLLEEGQVARLDLGVGGYGWKFEWTDDCEHIYRLTVTRRQRPKKALPKKSSTARPLHEREMSTNDMGGSGGVGSAPAMALAPSGPSRPDLKRQVMRTLRRAQRTLLARATKAQVLYLSRPTDVILEVGGRASNGDASRLVLVLLGHGEVQDRLDQVNKELAERLTTPELVAASKKELMAAAAQLGITEDRVVDLSDADGSYLDARGLNEKVRELAIAHPNAVHVLPSGEGTEPWVREALLLVAERARLHGLPVLRAAAVEQSRPWGESLRKAAEEFRHWDPQEGRYAVHRSEISRHLARRAGRISAQNPDLPEVSDVPR